MDLILSALNWFWMAITDESIAGAVKPRLMAFGALVVVMGHYAKKTKATWDDELVDRIRQRLFPGSK